MFMFFCGFQDSHLSWSDELQEDRDCLGLEIDQGFHTGKPSECHKAFKNRVSRSQSINSLLFFQWGP